MKSRYNHDDYIEIGVDEAGRGTLFGPVYACSVIWDTKLNNHEMSLLIKDSKKLSKQKRNKAYIFLIDNVQYGIGYASHNEIDNCNILQATKLAIERSMIDLNKKVDTKKIKRYIIDGIRWEKILSVDKDVQIISQIKGDQLYKSIAAASIIAKVEHDKAIDKIIEQHNDLNEKYDIKNNKGYGTKKHLIGLEKYGSSEYHRKTFKPCIK